MNHYAKLFLSFLLGILLFVTLALYVLAPLADTDSPEGVEGIISKTALTGYPKHLDSLCYGAGSAVIPLGALGFWTLVARWKTRYVFLLSSGWFAILLFVILKR